MAVSRHESASPFEACLDRIRAAEQQNLLTAGAVANITKWLTEPPYATYRPDILRHVDSQAWQVLDDVFWTVIPFGTGGRRGRMYPIGCNAINDRTMGESAQGLANYVKQQLGTGTELSCAIAYDTRHRSLEFAQLCAEIMVAAGFRVYLLQPFRSTPELSFLVRQKQCSCGIMVTASHNPPSDNAIKAYWSTGGQILPPHDEGVIREVMSVTTIHRANFDDAMKSGQIIECTAATDIAFQEAVVKQGFAGSRDVRILYSPLHGVGATAVVPVLQRDGFENVEVYAPHAEPSGDFPNVPGHVSNPENPQIFAAIIQHAQKVGADVILATDPDCDRMGCAAPVGKCDGEWRTLNGNQLGALLTDYVLERQNQTGNLSPDKYVVKTLVTTELIRRIADSYGVTTWGDLLVGFKWIGGIIDEKGPDNFLFGTEESHGFLTGQYARDKDGAVACMLMAELAAHCKHQGKSIHDKLESLMWQHGCHAERLVTQTMSGSEGMARMQKLMSLLRSDPPRKLAGMEVAQVRDYQTLTVRSKHDSVSPLKGPRGDLVFLDFAEPGNYVAIRPSGTEPKAKFYMFTFVPAEQLSDLAETRQTLESRLYRLQADLANFSEQV